MAIGLSCLSILDDDENPLRRALLAHESAPGRVFVAQGTEGIQVL